MLGRHTEYDQRFRSFGSRCGTLQCPCNKERASSAFCALKDSPDWWMVGLRVLDVMKQVHLRISDWHFHVDLGIAEAIVASDM